MIRMEYEVAFTDMQLCRSSCEPCHISCLLALLPAARSGPITLFRRLSLFALL